MTLFSATFVGLYSVYCLRSDSCYFQTLKSFYMYFTCPTYGWYGEMYPLPSRSTMIAFVTPRWCFVTEPLRRGLVRRQTLLAMMSRRMATTSSTSFQDSHQYDTIRYVTVCSYLVYIKAYKQGGGDDVPANQILQTCCKAQDGVRPSPDWRRARGRPLTTWIHQIRRDTGISVTDALELAGDRSFWRQIATAGCYGCSLRAMMMMMGANLRNVLRRT